MKQYNKYLVLILILVGILMLTGCNNVRLKPYNISDELDKVENDDTNKEDDQTDKVLDTLSSNNDNNDELDKEEPATKIQPIENIELIIFTVNSNSNLEPVTALVPADEEITPELIVDRVVDAMADQSLLVGIESVKTDGDAVIVSFYSDQPPLNNVGAGFETAILNALAQSLTDNLDDYHKVIYQVEGGPYSSGHIELDVDEVYHED